LFRDEAIAIVLKGEVSPFEEINSIIKDVADVPLENDVVIAYIFVSEYQFENRRSPLLINFGVQESLMNQEQRLA
jgi:hypothetical protein